MTNIMDIDIKPLTPDLTTDFLDFFDNRAFSDNSPEGPCYCTRFQMTKEQEDAVLFEHLDTNHRVTKGFEHALRKCAEQQIASGALQGYLAFANGVSIGWCNANDKANLPDEAANGARFYASTKKREKAVLCFEIAPEYRGKGVATALLQRVVTDAKTEGFTAVEGYPHKRDERYEWDFYGPIRLYEKAGSADFIKKTLINAFLIKAV